MRNHIEETVRHSSHLFLSYHPTRCPSIALSSPSSSLSFTEGLRPRQGRRLQGASVHQVRASASPRAARAHLPVRLQPACSRRQHSGPVRGPESPQQGLRTSSQQGLRTSSQQGLWTSSQQGLWTSSQQGLWTSSQQGLRTSSQQGLWSS